MGTEDCEPPHSGSRIKIQMQRIQGTRHFHWHISALLLLGLVPAFVLLHLPLRFAWSTFISAFFGFALQSLLLATVLYLVGFHRQVSLAPLLHRYFEQKARIPALIGFICLMFWEFGIVSGLVLTVLTIVLLELFDRSGGDPQNFLRWIVALALPGAYLFVGLVLVFAYNDIVAAARFTGAYDSFFQKVDSWLLKTSVVEISHYMAGLSPRWLEWSELIYYRMFPQIGAGLIVTALFAGKKEALRFVGTILTAYFLALALFAVLPSMGPFYLSPLSDPQSFTAIMQRSFVEKASALWQHKPIQVINTDYYIAFPCMHVAQPLIVLWFLRRWRRIGFVLVIFDVLMVPSILFLEWHYVVDLLAGILVAALAILLNRPAALIGQGKIRSVEKFVAPSPVEVHA
jgi:hypothetical protein